MSLEECKIVGENFCLPNRSEIYKIFYNQGIPECATDEDCSFWISYWSYKENEVPTTCGFNKGTDQQYCVANIECAFDFYCG